MGRCWDLRHLPDLPHEDNVRSAEVWVPALARKQDKTQYHGKHELGFVSLTSLAHDLAVPAGVLELSHPTYLYAAVRNRDNGYAIFCR